MIDGNEPTPDSIGSDALKASLFAKLFDKEPENVSVGRYRILDEIGAGGMGRVFSAYDEQLDRKVAIKVLHGAAANEQARRRLRREAQTLGRLTHPNVVTVHEIGEHDGQIFVAMEFVRGQTLRRWRAAEEREVRAILNVYLQAARGLQAAHDAGILHRDFKPDNAIHGDDGRVRVVDFGLARTLAEEGTQASARAPATSSTSTEVALTETGAMLGTPTYMAPEQFLGKPTDARTDQFAFCVALWEALYGERPFAGSTYADLGAHVTSGNRRAPPRDAGVPASIRTMLDIGLAADPEERHAGMAVVVATLDAELRPRRARWWIPATAVPVAVFAAFAVLRETPAPRSLEDCAAAAERLQGIWDDDVRRTVAAQFAATPAAYVAATWASAQREQDEAVAAWTRSYERACADASSGDAATRRLAAQRLDCLDAALSRLGILGKLDSADAAREFAAGYVSMFDGLGEEVACVNDDFVRRCPPPQSDPRMRARVLELSERLAAATAVHLVYGHPLEALAPLDRIVNEARALGDATMLAQALMSLTRVHTTLGTPEARATATEALHAAEAAGHDLLIFGGLLGRSSVAETDQERFELLDRADSVLARLGAPVVLEVRLALVRAAALDGVGRSDEAFALAQKVAQTHGNDASLPRQLRVAIYMTLASASGAAAQPQVRLGAARAALDVVVADLGPGHPATATPRDFAAYALFQLGRFEESVAEYRALVASLLVVFPDGLPRVGWAINQLARAEDAAGRVADAERSFVRSEAMLTRLLGPTHVDVLRGPALFLSGRALMTGDEPEFRRRAQSYRDSGLDFGPAWVMKAVEAALDGDAEVARTELLRTQAAMASDAVAVQDLGALSCYVFWLVGDRQAALAAAERLVADPLPRDYLAQGGLAIAGFVFAETGDYARALPASERALERAAKVAPPALAWYAPMAHYALAVALEGTGGDHDRAVQAARTALSQARMTGLPRLHVDDKAAAWLAAHAT